MDFKTKLAKTEKTVFEKSLETAVENPYAVGEKIDVRDCTACAIDFEWFSIPLEAKGKKIAQYLSGQMAWSYPNGKVKLAAIFWNDRYSLPSKTESDVEGCRVIIIPTSNLDEEYLLSRFLLPDYYNILMYYSPKDIQGILGKVKWRDEYLKKEKVKKLRRLHVKMGKNVRVIDLIGLFNSSLDDAFRSVGKDNPYKHLAKDKSRMDLFIREDPENFMLYALGDVIYLHKTLKLKIEQINEILKKSFGIDNFYNENSIKLTSGALVADVFEKWLIRKKPDLFKAAIFLSVSNNDSDLKKIQQLELLLNRDRPDLEYINREIKQLKATVHGLAAGSIRAFYPGNYGKCTVSYGAVVQGGRCVNEQPQYNFIKWVLDIDLSSCYGTALRGYDYPIGLPTLYWKGKADAKGLTLGKFLAKHKGDLIDGLYVIYVNGKLKFNQDLIHSKYGCTPNKIASQLFNGEFDTESDFSWEREVETAHIDGKFLLTLQELNLGVITSSNLEAIEAISTSVEYKQWMDLEVVCAVYYPKSLEVTEKKFVEIMKGEKTRGKDGYKGDTRTRKWCRLPLEDFIGEFIKTRKEYKATRNRHTKGSEEYRKYDLMQKAVKLFVNTTYGCLAAPYFPMGNTIIANNITAKARTEVWKMAKALNTLQSITDGGLVPVKAVHRLKTESKNFRKPGFNSLYVRAGESFTRNVEEIDLIPNPEAFVKDVIEAFKAGDGVKTTQLKDYIDKVATEHINAFWEPYGLTLNIDVEHKLENTGFAAAWLNSGDYAIDTGLEEPLIKCRGAKQKNHPKKQLLKAILYNRPLEEIEPTLEFWRLIGVNEWLENPDDDALPGDEIKQTFALKPRPDAGKLYPDLALKDKADKAHARKVRFYLKENENRDVTEWSKFHTLTKGLIYRQERI